MIDFIDINFLDFDFENLLNIEEKKDWWKDKMFKWIEDFGKSFFEKKIWWIPDFIVDLVKDFITLLAISLGVIVVFFLISFSPIFYGIYKIFRTLKPKKTDITN